MKKWLSLILAIIMVFSLSACGLFFQALDGEDEDQAPELTPEEYKAQCKTVDYKDLCRNPDKYQGEKVTVKVQIDQILDTSSLISDKAWRALTDNDGYGLFADDEYCMIDWRSEDSVKVLVGDVVIVYGEFAGMEMITREDSSNSEEVPRINVKYTDFAENAAEKTYEGIYEEYSQKMREATPGIVAEYQEEAEQNENGLNGLEEIYYEKSSELEKIGLKGRDEMSKLYEYSDEDTDDKYTEWVEKLYDVYSEENDKISNVYLEEANKLLDDIFEYDE